MCTVWYKCADCSACATHDSVGGKGKVDQRIFVTDLDVEYSAVFINFGCVEGD